MATIKGTGAIASTDYKAIKWVGKTKSGKAITITMPKAINIGNLDWTFAEKSDVVAAITFTAVYDNTDEPSASTEEPYTIECAETTSGAGEIALGAGLFYINDVCVGLTRGGGSFNVAREFRRINADGDRGPVEGRIELEGSEASITLNALQIMTKIAELYPAMA